MNKEKRKFYKIKEMRRDGLSYVERGEKISEMKKVAFVKEPKIVKEIKLSFWRRFWKRLINLFSSFLSG